MIRLPRVTGQPADGRIAAMTDSPTDAPATPDPSPAPGAAGNRGFRDAQGASGLPVARVGLCSTLTSLGSRQLVTTVARAVASGAIPGTAIAFLFVDREAGESPDTDASVAHVEAAFDFPVIRASAVRFRTDARKAARAAAEAGNPAPLWAWRDAFYASYRDRLPPTALDLLLGDMWIWGRRQCAERRGVNLHPSLPTGPLGKMWFDVVWDLVVLDAVESGVMLHLVTPEVDEGPVVAYCRYPLRGPGLDPQWATLPACLEDRAALVGLQRALKREATHPLFKAIRAVGLAREMPLMLETLRAVGERRLSIADGVVRDARGAEIVGGLDLTAEVEAAVAGARGEGDSSTGAAGPG